MSLTPHSHTNSSHNAVSMTTTTMTADDRSLSEEVHPGRPRNQRDAIDATVTDMAFARVPAPRTSSIEFLRLSVEPWWVDSPPTKFAKERVTILPRRSLGRSSVASARGKPQSSSTKREGNEMWWMRSRRKSTATMTDEKIAGGMTDVTTDTTVTTVMTEDIDGAAMCFAGTFKRSFFVMTVTISSGLEGRAMGHDTSVRLTSTRARNDSDASCRNYCRNDVPQLRHDA